MAAASDVTLDGNAIVFEPCIHEAVAARTVRLMVRAASIHSIEKLQWLLATQSVQM
jgi:hypothetical protein